MGTHALKRTNYVDSSGHKDDEKIVVNLGFIGFHKETTINECGSLQPDAPVFYFLCKDRAGG